MKKIKTKELALNKIKVATLDDSSQRALKGGAISYTCETIECQGTNSVIFTYQDCGKPILW